MPPLLTAISPSKIIQLTLRFACLASSYNQNQCPRPVIINRVDFTSASYNCFAQGNVSAEYECTVARPSFTSVIAAFSVLFKYKAPMKPPDLSTSYTSNSTSRCIYLRVAKSEDSAPKGSDFSDALRAVRGARIPPRTRVRTWLSLGRKIL